MDLRRVGEFAFGFGLFLGGGLFLALAVGRLGAPVVVLSVVAERPSTAPAVRTSVGMTMPRKAPVAPVMAQHVVVAERRWTAPAVRASVRMTMPGKAPVAPVTARHVVVAERRWTAPAMRASVRMTMPRKAPAAPAVAQRVVPSAARRVASSGVQERPAPLRRYGIAYVHVRPKAERTPEPPIGYVDHPALVSADGPSQAPPTMVPVQVELETTHLTH